MELIIKGLPEEVKAFLNGKVTLPMGKEVTSVKIEERTLFDGIEDEPAEEVVAEPEPTEVEQSSEQPKARVYRNDRWCNRGVRLPYQPSFVRIIKTDNDTRIYVLRQHKALLCRNGILMYESDTEKANVALRIKIKGNVARWLQNRNFEVNDRVDIDINKFIDEVKAI